VVWRRFPSSIPLLSQLKSIFEPDSIPGSSTERAAEMRPFFVCCHSTVDAATAFAASLQHSCEYSTALVGAMLSAIAVEESVKPGGMVRTERDLFDDADTLAVAHRGPDDVRYMYGRELGRVEIVETD
jgi:hypothetical protein